MSIKLLQMHKGSEGKGEQRQGPILLPLQRRLGLGYPDSGVMGPFISFHVSGGLLFLLLLQVSLLVCKLFEGRGCVFMYLAPPSLKHRCPVGLWGRARLAPVGTSDVGPRPAPPQALRSAPSSRWPLPAFRAAEVTGCSSLPTWRLFRCARPLRLSGPDLALTSGFPMCLRADIFAPTDHAQGSSLPSCH